MEAWMFFFLLFTGRWACNWGLKYNRQLTVFEKILLGIFGVYKTTEQLNMWFDGLFELW